MVPYPTDTSIQLCPDSSNFSVFDPDHHCNTSVCSTLYLYQRQLEIFLPLSFRKCLQSYLEICAKKSNHLTTQLIFKIVIYLFLEPKQNRLLVLFDCLILPDSLNFEVYFKSQSIVFFLCRKSKFCVFFLYRVPIYLQNSFHSSFWLSERPDQRNLPCSDNV